MEIETTEFKDLYILHNKLIFDDRGSFLKLFNCDFFSEHKLDTDFKEYYYSSSKKGVIRGMHFQIPPFHHTKLVYVSHGGIIDVVIDLRKSSTTYKKYFTIELNDKNGKYIYVPKGFAHGFLSLKQNTIVNYAQTSCYSKEHDNGILYNSFDFDWGLDVPIISERDLSFKELNNFNSPFI